MPGMRRQRRHDTDLAFMEGVLTRCEVCGERRFTAEAQAHTVEGKSIADIARLITLLDRLAATGSTLVMIEHNLHVIAAADWIVDRGPEAGCNSGRIVYRGTPTR